MSQWMAALLGLVAAALLGRLVGEWRRYARGEHIISSRQLALRAISAVLLVVLLALVVVGTNLQFKTVASEFIYWGICMVLAGAAIMLAMVDLWQVRRYARAKRAEMYQRISSYMRQVGERWRAGRAGDE